jgi:hypothetical protein
VFQRQTTSASHLSAGMEDKGRRLQQLAAGRCLASRDEKSSITYQSTQGSVKVNLRNRYKTSAYGEVREGSKSLSFAQLVCCNSRLRALNVHPASGRKSSSAMWGIIAPSLFQRASSRASSSRLTPWSEIFMVFGRRNTVLGGRSPFCHLPSRAAVNSMTEATCLQV